MIFHKLEQREHERTKTLYETVFSEDRGAFADYYYTWKTKDNTIYAAEDEDGIHAMVHLNPFEVSVYGKVQVLHYIVAVATEEEYRHRGLMRKLLNLAMRDMAENGEPFTFLMPASEAIYLPFGFRFASWQRQGILRAMQEKSLGHIGLGRQETEQRMLRAMQEKSSDSHNPEKEQKTGAAVLQSERETGRRRLWRESEIMREREQADQTGELSVREMSGSGSRQETQRGADEESARKCGEGCMEIRPVCPEEYQTLSDLVNEALAGQADIFIWRSRAYYERLVQEQRCQNGDVMVVLADGKIVGTFCTAREEPEKDSEEKECAFELREIISAEGFLDLVFEALQRFAGENGECKVYGCPEGLELAQEERVPLMMARRLSQREDSKETAPEEAGSPPIFSRDVVFGGTAGKEQVPPKTAETPENVIFINEVV